MTRLLLVACREHDTEARCLRTFGTALRNTFNWFPSLPEAFATIRPSTRSLSKKTEESYTLGTLRRHTRDGQNEVLDCQLSNAEVIQEPFRPSFAAQKRRYGKVWFSTESSAR